MSRSPDSPRARKAVHARVGRFTCLYGEGPGLSQHQILAGTALSWSVWPHWPSMKVFARMRLSHKREHTCQALTRRGTPCMALALENGRCRLHGGLSAGPKTEAGWARIRAGYRAWLERQRGGGPLS